MSELSKMSMTLILALSVIPFVFVAVFRLARAAYDRRDDQGEIIYEVRLA